jgi:hypothetical protein
MLIKKKWLHYINYINKQINIKTTLTVNMLYIGLQKQLLNNYATLIHSYLLNNSIMFLHNYSIQIIISNLSIFNSVFMFIFSGLTNLNLDMGLKFNLVKLFKTHYSMLRSTFVYNNSKDQLLCESYVGNINISIYHIDLFLITYLEF